MAPRGASLLVAARRRPSLASRILAIGGAVVPAPAVPSGPGPAVLGMRAPRADSIIDFPGGRAGWPPAAAGRRPHRAVGHRRIRRCSPMGFVRARVCTAVVAFTKRHVLEARE